MKNALFLVFLVFFLCGCNSIPPINFSVPNVGHSQKKIDAELKSLTVNIGTAEEGGRDVPFWASGFIIEPWRDATTDALNRMAIFQDDSSNKLNLSIKILNLQIARFSGKAEVSARYELIDRKNGTILLRQEITSEGDADFSVAAAGEARLRETLNLAARNNIEQFLGGLSTLSR